MIVIKHGCKPEPKRWKFVCECGCEWIADETEVARLYNYRDVCVTGLIYHNATCCCPDCGNKVRDERRISDDEYKKAFNKIGLPLFKITEEELH